MAFKNKKLNPSRFEDSFRGFFFFFLHIFITSLFEAQFRAIFEKPIYHTVGVQAPLSGVTSHNKDEYTH